jgi:hypothetical protein
MGSGARTTVTQWLLLCVLSLGVVGMHHVAMGDDTLSGHSMASATSHHEPTPEEPAPSPAHDMLHLCVAVLCAVGSMLLLAWLLLRVAHTIADRMWSTSAWPRAPEHPPPIGGRDLLSSLCVLRL